MGNYIDALLMPVVGGGFLVFMNFAATALTNISARLHHPTTAKTITHFHEATIGHL